MGENTMEPRPREVGRAERLVKSLITKLPPKTAAFWLRFTGVFVSRRMSMMAAVSAFWAIFALPWILIVFISVSALISRLMGNEAVEVIKATIIDAVNDFLTPEAAQEFAVPILDSLFQEGMAELGIIGLIVALWSGSKAVLTLMDAITFIEKNVAAANYFVRRALALGMLLGAVIAMAVVAPLVIVGPRRLGEWLNLPSVAVWILVVGFGLLVVFGLLLLLYKTSTMHFSHWDSYIPGAVLSTLISAIGTIGLAIYVRRLFENNAFLGALLTPIAMMTTAYVLCLCVLAGAVFNYVKALGPKVDVALTVPLAHVVAKFDNGTTPTHSELGQAELEIPGEKDASGSSSEPSNSSDKE